MVRKQSLLSIYSTSNRDIKNSLGTAIEKGREEGRKEGKAEGRVEANIETASKMLSDGMPADIVMKYTGLLEEDIEKINVQN